MYIYNICILSIETESLRSVNYQVDSCEKLYVTVYFGTATQF